MAGHGVHAKSLGLGRFQPSQRAHAAKPIILCMKNKTLATWLSFLGGPVGLHRFYMFGKGDWLAWVLPWPTLLGLYGFQRAQDFGVDDPISWLLLPLLGITIAGGALNAIYWGLMSTERWNSTYNPQDEVESPAGATNWLIVVALVLSLMVGTTALLSTLAYGFQRYFESQIEEARKISQ